MIMKHPHPERKRGISHDYYETLHPPTQPMVWIRENSPN